MAATQRKIIFHVDSESSPIEKKRAAILPEEEDRLSELPEALKLCILAHLDTKHAVQTTMLSKKWVNLWTRVPVLNFNYSSFTDVRVFERFVDQVLWARDPLAKLEGFKFNGHESCIPKLEASMETFFVDDSGWPVSVCDSLTSLELQTVGPRMRCRPFLGPSSTSFKNLTVLYLNRALITDVDPFVGFMMLESMTLIECKFWAQNNMIMLKSDRLSDLTMSYCKGVKWVQLKTPRLRFLEYEGFGDNFPKHEGFPVLESLKIDFCGFIEEEEKRLQNDELMNLFCTIPNVKSVTLFSNVVFLLSLFPDELVRRGPPHFRELKELTMHVSEYCVPCKCFSLKAYLLHNSPHAKFSVFGRWG